MKKEVKYTKDGKETVIVVEKPNSKQLADAQMHASKMFARLINDKDENGNPTALLRSKLNDYMWKVGLWDEAKEKELTSLNKIITDFEKALTGGGIKLSEARKICLDIRRARNEQVQLLAKKMELDAYTAEGIAENERFHYLASVCLRDEEGNRLFSSVSDYKEKSNTDEIYKAAFELAGMLTDRIDTKWEDNLPENKFLKKYKFIDEKLRLINKDGHLVDSENRLINEDGRFVAYDTEGVQYFVDKDGNKVDKDGNPVMDTLPFLDDEGNPV